MLKPILLAAAAVVAAGGIAFADDGLFPTPTGWGGYYLGLNGGYGKVTASDGEDEFSDLLFDGGFFGGQAGFNFVLTDNFVVGLQGDVDWTRESGSYGRGTTTIGEFDNATLTDRLEWTGAFTGHVGVNAGPVMAYALAGVAFAKSELDNVGQDQLEGASPIESDLERTHIGWTAGAGLSGMIGPLSSFIEYRYSDYGTQDYSAAVGDSPVRLTDQQIRVGLNYHKQ